MKRYKLSVIAIAAAAFLGGYSLSEVVRVTRALASNAATLRAAERDMAHRYPLQNAAAADAADQLVASLGTTCPEIATDVEANALTVSAPSTEHERISRLLAKIDARPLTVTVQCSLVRTDENGKRVVLYRPQIQTLDGMEGLFSIGRAGESIEVTVLPKVILSQQEQDALTQASFAASLARLRR